jgi:2-hydroxy-3-keto-5-methylthiopentenyl-1-phosphate phosphatase
MDLRRPLDVRAPSLVPPPAETQVWIDFDGTITQKDVLDELIRGYAIDESWKLAEQQWQEGAIGSQECLSRQFAVVRIGEQELDRFLDTIPLDDGIFALLKLLDRFHVPYAVLSDGVDRFIKRLFQRNGLDRVPVRCNTIIRDGDAMALSCPHGSPACESAAAHCKCASMLALASGARKSIFIGDGRSDLCPSRRCACVFAKGVLAANLEAERQAFLPYSTLHEVRSILATAWGADPETQ